MSFVAFRLGFPAVAFWHSCHLLCQNTSGRSAFIQAFQMSCCLSPRASEWRFGIYESYYIGMHLGVVPLYRLSQMSFCLSPRVSEWRFDIYESYYVGIHLGIVPLFRLSQMSFAFRPTFRLAFWFHESHCRSTSGPSAFIQAFADVVLPFPSGFRVAV